MLALGMSNLKTKQPGICCADFTTEAETVNQAATDLHAWLTGHAMNVTDITSLVEEAPKAPELELENADAPPAPGPDDQHAAENAAGDERPGGQQV